MGLYNIYGWHALRIVNRIIVLMILILALALVFSIILTGSAQPLEQWNKTFAGSGHDNVYSVQHLPLPLMPEVGTACRFLKVTRTITL